MTESNDNKTSEANVENDPDVEKSEFMWVWIISIAGSIYTYSQLENFIETLWLNVTLSITSFIVLFVISTKLRKYIAIVGALIVVIAVIVAFSQGVMRGAAS